MSNLNKSSIVDPERFIESTRDAGYKSISFAVAELLDNSIEAGADKVQIFIDLKEMRSGCQISVLDNGHGMKKGTLAKSLIFGGTSRFNSRLGSGRFGMGLPNSSLSQAKRVEVFSWTKPNEVWWNYLDVDEVVDFRRHYISSPVRKPLPSDYEEFASSSGTLVTWSKCDRVKYKYAGNLAKKLAFDLGRIYREEIWGGTTIAVDSKEIEPRDPLFLQREFFGACAKPYGPPLEYLIEVPCDKKNQTKASRVVVRFSELPIETWHSLPNVTKRKLGISKGAGVSVLRASREIDYGWFLLGSKRKENYDDWWRCEISFDARLDEFFGVTNTKQGIRPSRRLKEILSADLEQIAVDLNRRVRDRFTRVRNIRTNTNGVRIAEQRDGFLEPPKNITRVKESSDELVRYQNPTESEISGLRYQFISGKRGLSTFIKPIMNGKELNLLLNEDHPFFGQVYSKLISGNSVSAPVLRAAIELLLLSYGRAEVNLSGEFDSDKLRDEWSAVLAAFIK